MTTPVDRWMLPDGISEVLPPQAEQIEQLRRQILDLYGRWGYDLVIPPVLEFAESLLLGTNRDLDLQTFKVTDQLSGRSMGIPADITPQAARIDAHSLNRSGPLRLCYAGHVLHTRPANALASRSPIQVGVECFGIAGLMADTEVISLMAESLRCAGLARFTIGLGHVEIFRELAQQSSLDAEQTEALLDILQRKAAPELESFIQRQGISSALAVCWRDLLKLNGDVAVLARARKLLAHKGVAIQAALADLDYVAQGLQGRYPDVALHVDLAELPGYHYHNGIVFAAYVEGAGAAVANGGRYDALCELFGRARPATGFNADLLTLARLGQRGGSSRPGILAIASEEAPQWQAIASLRAQGERVVVLPAGVAEKTNELNCDRELRLEQGRYLVRARVLN